MSALVASVVVLGAFVVGAVVVGIGAAFLALLWSGVSAGAGMVASALGPVWSGTAWLAGKGAIVGALALGVAAGGAGAMALM